MERVLNYVINTIITSIIVAFFSIFFNALGSSLSQVGLWESTHVDIAYILNAIGLILLLVEIASMLEDLQSILSVNLAFSIGLILASIVLGDIISFIEGMLGIVIFIAYILGVYTPP